MANSNSKFTLSRYTILTAIGFLIRLQKSTLLFIQNA